MANLVYRDTRNYAPIDVTKGIDLTTGETVMADAEAPKGAEAMPKCKLCKNFKSTEEYLGTCEASMNNPKFVAYPDMVAVTCGMYKA